MQENIFKFYNIMLLFLALCGLLYLFYLNQPTVTVSSRVETASVIHYQDSVLFSTQTVYKVSTNNKDYVINAKNFSTRITHNKSLKNKVKISTNKYANINLSSPQYGAIKYIYRK